MSGQTVFSSSQQIAIDWLSAMTQGNHEAMSAFYDHFAPLVFTLVMRIVRSRADAEEVCEDVFCEIWQRASTYSSDRGLVSSWVLTLARSRAIDRLRRLRRASFVPVDESAAAQGLSNINPTLGISEREEQQTVRNALGQISTEQRQALELAYFDGLSHSEIAIRLSRPLGTIKSHIRLGLIQMREILRTYIQ
jgi:RNA polymerase sigma-70 factor, ECF subfamily